MPLGAGDGYTEKKAADPEVRRTLFLPDRTPREKSSTVCFSSFYTYKIEYFCSLSKPDDALGGAKRVACLLNHMHYLSPL